MYVYLLWLYILFCIIVDCNVVLCPKIDNSDSYSYSNFNHVFVCLKGGRDWHISFCSLSPIFSLWFCGCAACAGGGETLTLFVFLFECVILTHISFSSVELIILLFTFFLASAGGQGQGEGYRGGFLMNHYGILPVECALSCLNALTLIVHVLFCWL